MKNDLKGAFRQVKKAESSIAHYVFYFFIFMIVAAFGIQSFGVIFGSVSFALMMAIYWVVRFCLQKEKKGEGDE